MAILDLNMGFNDQNHGGGARRQRPLVLRIVLALLAGSVAGFAQAAPQPEHQVKAAFLFNFPKYVDWPADAFAETNSPIVIATIGETGLGDELRELVSDKTVNGRPLVFKVVAENSAADCHILFIPESARRRVPAILQNLKGATVLTVGESDDFLDKGGIINLARRDHKIRLEVNLATARQAGLKISSKLLSVADVVKGK
ncbi:MAG: YfiR family protein [Verrucomicrobia bacterium]|nr:YfiR family protein [Verrucomicrobiota bacterium]